MPAKLQLDVLRRTPAVSARHGTQTLKNSTFSDASTKANIVFASHILPGTFSSQFKYCSTSVFDSRKVAHTL
ncbi:CPI_1c_G0052230.mRNA.1.CDS.1 [Saccharomyces cerevisiae]|nr:CPI_1c_G0052230.mRNA.1.CDS.1 [Saccharomyces cerevisiae]CAI7470915.1 CPI_1c_G0052230.mRNA.1.CDS.1 [Saccharomyces cerevisiae]